MVEAVSDQDQIINKMNTLLSMSPQCQDWDTKSDKTNTSNEKSTYSIIKVDSEISEKELAHQKIGEIVATENFVNSSMDIEPFFIANMNSVKSQYHKWMRCLPRFTPFYAVKCNNNEVVLRTLISLGTSFDCASMEEIKTILNFGIPPRKIIYANPCKSPVHLKYAASVGVSKMTFDNADELLKIKQYYPAAELVIRVHVDDSKSICQFGVKFGVRLGQTKPLLEMASKLGLKVIGVSFHVGSGCTDPSAYNDALKRAREVFEEGRQMGYEFSLLDIGGGFPGLSVAQNGVKIQFEDIAEVINKAMDEHFAEIKDLQLIAEPGRFFASTAFTLVTNITSRRTIETEEGPTFMYYINDGVYGSFNCLIFDHADLPQPRFLIKNLQDFVSHTQAEDCNDGYLSSVWGPTCDSMDCLTKAIKLPQLAVGDWLIFDNMGAYTLVAASRFNGMNNPKVLYLDSDTEIPCLKPTYITPYEPDQKASLIKEDFVLS